LAGIYIHIPFCKQACTYCDFHFSTLRKNQPQMVNAICKELQLRKNEFDSEKIETLYFGGGTPSVLTIIEWVQIFKCVQQNYNLDKNAEITVEANPDDLIEEYIRFLHQLGVNRLSIGIQSFFDLHLKWMNRAHNAEQAINCIEKAKEIGITNITIDLIYGIPLMTLEEWKKNIDLALSMNIPHISCYNLTVESKTKLANDIKKGKSLDVDDEQSHIEYTLLCKKLKAAGYIHYEISNFGKLGYFSRHNTAYWQNKNYLGIGPSAHSFNGKERLWNISNNSIYIEKLEKNELPQTLESLTNKDLFNEHILIGFRTIWGCDLTYLKSYCNLRDLQKLITRLKKMELEGFIEFKDQLFFTTEKGKNFADRLASDLFLTD